MTVIYGLDPGTTQSAIVTLAGVAPACGQILDNEDLLRHLRAGTWLDGTLVIEKIESFGMAVGAETFETVFWSGCFAEAWNARGRSYVRIGRREVKLHLCGSARAKDPNIRQALLDKFGGATAAKKGGALAGIKSHLWASLAVAITYRDSLSSSAVSQRREEVTWNSRT